MQDLIEHIGLLALVVGAATEGLGRILDRPKDTLAAIIGPVAGIAAHSSGLLGLSGEGIASYLAAAFWGLVAGVGAGIANDYIVRAFRPSKLTSLANGNDG